MAFETVPIHARGEGPRAPSSSRKMLVFFCFAALGGPRSASTNCLFSSVVFHLLFCNCVLQVCLAIVCLQVCCVTMICNCVFSHPKVLPVVKTQEVLTVVKAQEVLTIV